MEACFAEKAVYSNRYSNLTRRRPGQVRARFKSDGDVVCPLTRRFRFSAYVRFLHTLCLILFQMSRSQRVLVIPHPAVCLGSHPLYSIGVRSSVCHVPIVVRFREDNDILRDLVHLEEAVVVGNEAPFASVRRVAWCMLYAEDAGIVSKFAERLAKSMTYIVTVLQAAGLTISDTRTETMLLRPRDYAFPSPPLVIEVTGQRYRQASKFL